jgi:hypothetical protein
VNADPRFGLGGNYLYIQRLRNESFSQNYHGPLGKPVFGKAECGPPPREYYAQKHARGEHGRYHLHHVSYRRDQ